ncbi:hypothetical protein BD311DRAFT_671880, partial [Dichomitus squalens]
LLKTSRAEAKFVPTPENMSGGYAILPHVWDEHETAFQDIQAFRVRCAESPKEGHEYGQAGTCCIDKTGSAELAEVINSMYHYCSLANICVLYLRDVPTSSADILRQPKSAFRESRWYQPRRTLQEPCSCRRAGNCLGRT